MVFVVNMRGGMQMEGKEGVGFGNVGADVRERFRCLGSFCREVLLV